MGALTSSQVDHLWFGDPRGGGSAWTGLAVDVSDRLQGLSAARNFDQVGVLEVGVLLGLGLVFLLVEVGLVGVELVLSRRPGRCLQLDQAFVSERASLEKTKVLKIKSTFRLLE